MKKQRKLRFQLLIPLVITFLLLWLGTMLLLTDAKARELEEQAVNLRSQVVNLFKEERDCYQKNLDSGLGREADQILIYNMSKLTGNLYELNGGIAIAMRGANREVLHTQLASGYAHEDGLDQGQRWHLLLDQGLDDEGMIALTHWIIDHRDRGWAYTLYPPESMGEGDGTLARVTGREDMLSHAIEVQKIELVHPDGTVETVAETGSRCINPKVMEFRHMTLHTQLVSPWYSDGRRDYSGIEKRLENYRAAQAGLSQGLGGQGGPVTYSTGMYHGFDPSYEMTCVYQVMPTVLRQLSYVYVSTLVLTALVLLMLSRVLTRKVTVPVEVLCREIRQGSCGEDGSVEELNVLAAAFNAQQKKMEVQLQREREFTWAAAHELKTPLAVLRTHAEALQEDVLPEKREEYWSILFDETDQMSDLVARMLELSRLEAGMPMNEEKVELDQLIRELLVPLEPDLNKRGIRTELALKPISYTGDRLLLKEAAENLVTNALRYGEEGGKLAITLAETDKGVCLTIDNDGPAIPEEGLPHLFEPFWRVDKSRSRASGGTGLGLPIVKAVMDAHGGSCTVENRPGGVQARLTLPLELGESSPPLDLERIPAPEADREKPETGSSLNRTRLRGLLLGLAVCLILGGVLWVQLSPKDEAVPLPGGKRISYLEVSQPETHLQVTYEGDEVHRDLTEEEMIHTFGDLNGRVGASFAREDGRFLTLSGRIEDCGISVVAPGVPYRESFTVPEQANNSLGGRPLLAGYYNMTVPQTDGMTGAEIGTIHIQVYFIQFELDGNLVCLEEASLPDEPEAILASGLVRTRMAETAYQIMETGLEGLSTLRYEA